MTTKNHVTAYSRGQLDDFLTSRLGFKVSATDEQWNQVFDCIHNDDEAWGYINDTICKAEEEIITPLVNSLK